MARLFDVARHALDAATRLGVWPKRHAWAAPGGIDEFDLERAIYAHLYGDRDAHARRPTRRAALAAGIRDSRNGNRPTAAHGQAAGSAHGRDSGRMDRAGRRARRANRARAGRAIAAVPASTTTTLDRRGLEAAGARGTRDPVGRTPASRRRPATMQPPERLHALGEADRLDRVRAVDDRRDDVDASDAVRWKPAA